MTITDRIDAITHIDEGHLKPDADIPRSVKIELTARCNFACTFCARVEMLREQQDMDWDFFTRITQEMRREGVEELGLFYLGESFLCPWLPEAVEHAKKDCGYPYVFLTTNGSLATPEKCETLFRNGLDSLKFSFNYADRNQFTEVARVKPKLYDAMVRNIKAAMAVRDKVEAETGHRCGLYASYIEYDGEQGERMKAAIAEVEPYLDEVYGLPLYSQASLVEAAEKEMNWMPTAGNRGRLGALRKPLPCWSIFTEGHVTYDGRLSACCFDHDGRFNMGDLTKMSFREAWNSATFQELRKAHLKGDVRGTVCESCVAYS